MQVPFLHEFMCLHTLGISLTHTRGALTSKIRHNSLQSSKSASSICSSQQMTRSKKEVQQMSVHNSRVICSVDRPHIDVVMTHTPSPDSINSYPDCRKFCFLQETTLLLVEGTSLGKWGLPSACFYIVEICTSCSDEHRRL